MTTNEDLREIWIVPKHITLNPEKKKNSSTGREFDNPFDGGCFRNYLKVLCGAIQESHVLVLGGVGRKQRRAIADEDSKWKRRVVKQVVREPHKLTADGRCAGGDMPWVVVELQPLTSTAGSGSSASSRGASGSLSSTKWPANMSRQHHRHHHKMTYHPTTAATTTPAAVAVEQGEEATTMGVIVVVNMATMVLESQEWQQQ
ncbi:hypothetical protein Pelo_19302 [Pelomyxa schiedti]|nr:hypothetical protein Pelo_19302 [Pelomyxa schiedti]